MLDGERSAKIDASVSAVYAVVADLPGYVHWHPFFASVDVLDTDDEGRASKATCTHPTPVATLKTEMRFSYDPENGIEAERTGGDLKAMLGTFHLQSADGSTIVTHRIVVDPGMRLGLLLRGPVEDKVRESVLNGALTGLAERVGASAGAS